MGITVLKIIAEKICLSVMYYILKQENVKKCIRMGITVLKIIAEKICLSAMHYTLKHENVKKCIRMGINCTENYHWGVRLLVSWYQIAFLHRRIAVK